MGFFVPGSKSSSYVAGQRTEEGSYLYDAAAGEIGLQKQAALQDLEKSYASTVENAYASYLANQRAINASSMGQGYKEAYEQAQQQQLASNIAEASKTTANVRAEIEGSAEKARTTLEQQFATETAQLDRAQSALTDYLQYLKDIGYTKDMTTELTLQEAFRAQPQSYTDPLTAEAALPFSNWLQTKLTDKTEDTDWANWYYYQGGRGQFEDYLGSLSKPEKPYIVQREEAATAEINKLLQENNLPTDLIFGEFKSDEERLSYLKQNINKVKTDYAKNQTKGFAGTAEKVKTSNPFASQYWKVGDKKYTGNIVSADSKVAQEINDKLGIPKKIKSSTLKVGDIITYNNKYYVIASLQAGPGTSPIYQQLNNFNK